MEIDFGSLASNTCLGPFSDLATEAMPDILAGHQLAGCPYARVAEAMKGVENATAERDRYKGTWSTQRHITQQVCVIGYKRNIFKLKASDCCPAGSHTDWVCELGGGCGITIMYYIALAID